MHAHALLHTRFAKICPEIHLGRLNAVIAAVDGLLSSQTLQLTAIGRALSSATAEKHAIKRVDRLLGNIHLAGDRLSFYDWMTAQLLGSKKHPVIAVDFSDVNAAQTHFIIRASVVLGGRTLSLYEEVHDKLNNPQLLRGFLQVLATMLPHNCQPVIVTDAGFRGTWRSLVLAHGWYYVMRQRNREMARFSADEPWQPCKLLYAKASATPHHLGTISINRNSPQQTEAYVYAEPAKKRIARTKKGERKKSTHSEKNAAREREPWLLLSNLPVSRNIAEKVVDIYRQRMQIEEAFRDLKSHRYGFAFRGNNCRCSFRLEALLLLAALAMFIAWLAGLHAMSQSLHYGMQANTERNRNVLSVLTIGLRYLNRYHHLTGAETEAALAMLRDRVEQFIDS